VYGRNPTGHKSHRAPQPNSKGTAVYGRNPTGHESHRPPQSNSKGTAAQRKLWQLRRLTEGNGHARRWRGIEGAPCSRRCYACLECDPAQHTLWRPVYTPDGASPSASILCHPAVLAVEPPSCGSPGAPVQPLAGRPARLAAHSTRSRAVGMASYATDAVEPGGLSGTTGAPMWPGRQEGSSAAVAGGQAEGPKSGTPWYQPTLGAGAEASCATRGGRGSRPTHPPPLNSSRVDWIPKERGVNIFSHQPPYVPRARGARPRPARRCLLRMVDWTGHWTRGYAFLFDLAQVGTADGWDEPPHRRRLDSRAPSPPANARPTGAPAGDSTQRKDCLSSRIGRLFALIGDELALIARAAGGGGPASMCLVQAPALQGPAACGRSMKRGQPATASEQVRRQLLRVRPRPPSRSRGR
jgi:hypothetical protein